MTPDFLAATLVALGALLPILNPAGALPLFARLTASFSHTERRAVARRAGIWTAAILLAFAFLGNPILGFFGIDLAVLRIAGGLVIGASAWEMLHAAERVTEDDVADAATRDTTIALTPLAHPMLAGPGSIGVVMSIASRAETPAALAGIVIAALVAGTVSAAVLAGGDRLLARLGRNGIDAMSRIFGLFFLAYAVTAILEGLASSPTVARIIGG